MNIPEGWRWVGKMAEGPCEVKACGHVFQTSHMPEHGDAKCYLCRVIEDARSLSTNAQKLAWEREALRRELETALRRIGELEDDLAEARDARDIRECGT